MKSKLGLVAAIGIGLVLLALTIGKHQSRGWEYATVPVRDGWRMNAGIDEWGSAGWEAVAVVNDPSWGQCVLMKRREPFFYSPEEPR